MSVVEDRVLSKKKRKKKSKAKGAKKSLGTRFLAGDDAAYLDWQAYLRARKSPRALKRTIKSKQAPLRWGLETIDVHPSTLTTLDQLWNLSSTASANGSAASIASAAREWLERAHATLTFDWALLSVAWAESLPSLASLLEAPTWRRLFDQLLCIADEAAASGYRPESLAQHLFAVELPLTLAYQVPESDRTATPADAGIDALCDGLLERHDGAGLPSAADIRHLRAWLATWTRSLHLAIKSGRKVSRKPMEQFDWLVRHALRLTRADQSQVFWPEGLAASKQTRALFDCALKMTGDVEDKALAALILDGDKVRDSRLPVEPGYESEWARFAVLQPEWAPDQPRLAVDYSAADEHVQVEFSLRGDIISQGAWSTRAFVNSRSLRQETDWESICWYEDDDADFLEIECELNDGWKMQRQFLLARQDYFLFMGDALIRPAGQTANIRLEQSIPFAQGVSCPAESETVERFIIRGAKRAVIIPAALSEWRSERRLGTLEVDGQKLVQTTQVNGTCAYLPLFVDVHPRRHRQPLTWRQLTVGQDLRPVSRDQAVGYRVHVGPEQWLFYRSMMRAVRSVLGQNLLSDFLCARFLQDGTTDTIIEIEDE